MYKKGLLWTASAALTGLLLAAATGSTLQGAARAAVRPVGLAAAPGAVVINEVAWMGTAASYADEWIELYNTTDTPISLDNWTLVADDGSPSIPLSGPIPAHGFFLLERTDDSTINGIPADLVYAGALENDPEAEALSLLDGNGQLIDRVNGDGGAWPAGDNTGKHTMERKEPLAPGNDDNWADNDGVTRQGLDADGLPINGTPRARNSAHVGSEPGAADLHITKSGPPSAVEGAIITYTVRLSNTGALAAASVRITDRLPPALTFISQMSQMPFNRDGALLVWAAGEIATDTPPVVITVTGLVSGTLSKSMHNVVTVTTTTSESVTGNNHAVWETQIVSGTGEANVLISALVYEGYQLDDLDEAIQLTNAGDASADLSGWKICDGAAGAHCAAIITGTLNPGSSVWLAYWASAFYTSSGDFPAFAAKGLLPGVRKLSGAWPGYANTGDEAVLRDNHDRTVDTLVFEDGDVLTPGWRGAAVQPWLIGNEGVKGQILYRKRDEATELPIPDSDTGSDWAQDPADPIYGRRARYPGWDLETFFHPLQVVENAHIMVGVTPDNGTDVVLEAIDAAQHRIEISIYSVRHPTVIQKLVDKASSGVTVTLLLEGDPVAMAKTDARWYQQMWACQRLHDTGRGACWFMINDPAARVFDRYSYMHAKYALIDRNQVLITSQNLTERGLPDDDRANGTCGSRGIVLLTDAPSIVARVAQIFDHDLDPLHHADLLAWSPTGTDYGPPPIGFTPVTTVTDVSTYTVQFGAPWNGYGTYSFELFSAPEAALRQRDALFGLLAQAGPGDKVYVEALDERAAWGDDPLADPSLRMESFIAAARRGAKVRILLNGGSFDVDYLDQVANLNAVAFANDAARAEGLDLVAVMGDPTQYGIHNKMVLVWLADRGGYVHLGSLNGSETASKGNRELALQVQSDPIYGYLKRVFDWDWNISRPLYLPLVTRQMSAPEPPVPYPVISEVLFNPSGADDSSEWVELYNPTDRTIDLSGWLLGDVGPAGEYGSGLYAFPAGTLLPAGATLLIARQAQDVVTFVPNLEFLIDSWRDDLSVPNMAPAGQWDGFGFALGNAGDEVLLFDRATQLVDGLVYGTGAYPGIIAHPGVEASGHSLERRPAIYDSDDCSQDFFDRVPPDPGDVSLE